MTAGDVKERDAMTTEELAAENGRLEQELRQAIEANSWLEKELSAEQLMHEQDVAELNGRITEIQVQQQDVDSPEKFELEIPGVIRLVLSGRAASVVSEKLVSRQGGGRD